MPLRSRVFWNDGGSLVILTHQALADWQGADLTSLIDGDSSGSSDYDRVRCLDGRRVEGFRIGSGWAIALGAVMSQAALWLPTADAGWFYAVGFEWAEDTDPQRLIVIAESTEGWRPIVDRVAVGPNGLLLAHAASTMTAVRERPAIIAADAAADRPAEIGDGLRFLPQNGDYAVTARDVHTDAGDSLVFIRFSAIPAETSRSVDGRT